MNDWFVLDLEEDPAPGDPAEIRTLAARLQREAEYAEAHSDRLRRIAANIGNLHMQGNYAPQFEQMLTQLPEQATQLGPAHADCGIALSAYAESLEQAKIQAGIALSRGIQADAQYRGALQQFYSLVPVTPSGEGIWRGLNAESAGYYSAYQEPEICQTAVRIGAYAGQAEQERQLAGQMAREAAQSQLKAEAQCAAAIRVAAPTNATVPGSRVAPEPMTTASQTGGGGRKTWEVTQGVAGPARGKTLRAPHPRHSFRGINPKNVQSENSLILPEARQAVDGDIEAIAAGHAHFDADRGRYEINGRSYGVEESGTVFPDSGPGILKIGRVEYSALAMIKKAGGDLSKVEKAFANAPKFVNNPQAVQTALIIYRMYTR